MPSPFPGMDPYLEGELFQEFHETLASAIRGQLMEQLRPKYVALLAKRYTFDLPGVSLFDAPSSRVFYPDVHLVRRGLAETAAQPLGAVVDEPGAELSSFLNLPLLSVEIRDVAERRLVTAIEILSPANKYTPGFEEYLQRRIELLKTETHLLEIDLVRQGRRLPFEGFLPPAHYYVYLSRTQRRPNTQIWPVHLYGRLPRVPVPLLAPDPDVVLDLQRAVDACFALVGYDLLLDYTQAPPPPELTADELAWVKERLQTWGLGGGAPEK
jgi:hypothetical protein